MSFHGSNTTPFGVFGDGVGVVGRRFGGMLRSFVYSGVELRSRANVHRKNVPENRRTVKVSTLPRIVVPSVSDTKDMVIYEEYGV